MMLSTLIRVSFTDPEIEEHVPSEGMGQSIVDHLEETFNDDGSMTGTVVFTAREQAAIQAALQCLAQCRSECGGDLPDDLIDTMTCNGTCEALGADELADLAAKLA